MKRVAVIAGLIVAGWSLPVSSDECVGSIYVDASNAGVSDGSLDRPYPTIAAAMAAVTTGGTICVAPGIYRENVVMAPNVTLCGTGSDRTVIDGGGSGSVVRMASNCVLRGFTIRNGTGSPHIYSSSVTWYYRNGGGVYCNGISNSTIEHNVIEDCHPEELPYSSRTSLYGGAVFLWNCSVIVRYNVIRANRASYGPAIYCQGSHSEWAYGSPGSKIYNNTFVENETVWFHAFGPGTFHQTVLCLDNAWPPVTFKNNIFANNPAGGLMTINTALNRFYRYPAIVEYNLFWNNSYGSDPFLINNFGRYSVHADPQFVDPTSRDYHILPTSPCVDAGDPSGAYADLDGTPNDIGALPYVNPDSIPPEIAVSLSPGEIWPPNQKMVELSIALTVTDNKDPSPDAYVSAVEIQDAEYDLTSDVRIEDGRIWVRATRSGNGSGRTYVFTWTAVDDAGNSSTATASVFVPHDQGK